MKAFHQFMVWRSFVPQNRPEKGQMCLFSDGVCGFWVGWYSIGDGEQILLQRGLLEPHHSHPADGQFFGKIEYWTPLGNVKQLADGAA